MSVINTKKYSVLYLAIGLASSILILLWVQNELSYDKFHKNANQVYRIATNLGDLKAAVNSAGMPDGLKAQIPVFKNTVRLSAIPVNMLFDAGDKKFEEKRVFYADPSFMDVFSFPLVQGDRTTALTNVDAVLITQEMATKYFGNQNPIGKILRKDNSENVVVSGVFANIPANSHLQFDIILPMASLARTNSDLKQNTWDNFNFYNSLTRNFTIISDLPTNLANGTISVNWDGKDPHSQVVIPQMDVNEGFTHVFKIKLLTGRSFSNSFIADSNNYMVNEKMLSVMGLNVNTAIGKTLTFHGNKGNIIGVVKNFNFKPVQQAIEPLVLRFNKSGGFLIVRTVPGKTNATIQALGKISQGLNPAYPFKFDFIDQDLSSLYKGEQQMGNIFNLFAILGLVISCMGLYGLSAFMTEQRKKEIGVRKVLGASVLSLVYLLSSGITRLILIAVAIAIPLSWYAVNSWLSGFAYHINVSWLIFLTASVAALFIAWVTTGYESVKAAIVNPIKSLKTK